MPTIKEKLKIFFSSIGSALRIILLVLSAMLGLWLSTQFILPKGKNAPFHEIDWSPKNVIKALVIEARDSVNVLTKNLISRRADEILKMRGTKLKSDSSSVGRKKINDEAKFLRTRLGIVEDSLERKQLDALDNIEKWLATNSDTTIKADLSKRSALFIDVRDFSIDDHSLDKDSTKLTPALKVTYVDPNLFGGQISGNVFLPIKKYPATERFFNKYPGFALWTLLLIIQAILFCVLIVGFLFHLLSKSDNSLFKKHLEFSPGRTILLLLSVVGLLILLFLTLLNDKDGQLVSGNIFMHKLHSLFFTVNLLGYIAASFCLVGMINCVMYLARLKKEIESAKEAALQAQLPQANQGNIKVLDSAIIESLRKEIKQRFNLYFILTATILSLAIITSGIFFSSMNNMDFIKQVTKDQGYSTVNSEMVYIYAIMNSFFLILVYLPVRYLIDSLDKAIPSVPPVGAEPPPNGNDDKKTFFSKLSDKLFGLKDLAIAASPILASLLQNLFDLLFK